MTSDLHREARELIDAGIGCIDCAGTTDSERVEKVIRGLLAENQRLAAESDEYDALIGRQGQLITDAVNALRGDPPPLTTWSHHDVADLARQAIRERDEARAVVDRLTRRVDTLTTREKLASDIIAGHSARIERVRALDCGCPCCGNVAAALDQETK